MTLSTNFLSNMAFFERYGANILGVSGTLGNDAEKLFMKNIFLVHFVEIPRFRREKVFELDGVIIEQREEWKRTVSEEVESKIAINHTAVLVVCEDIKTANDIYGSISGQINNEQVHLYAEDDACLKSQKTFVLASGDVVITTNLGSRGTDFTPDSTVNQNGGLFVLVTFLPANDRVQKQAFGRTGRRGATGSCQIIINRDSMPTYLRQCETVKEAKRLRDCIAIHRLNDSTDVNMMRIKQKLFKKYCELKKGFVNTCTSKSEDLKIQNRTT